MTHARVSVFLLYAFSMGAAATPAQEPLVRQQPRVERQAPQPEPGSQIVLAQDARETRKQFEDLLKRLPPAVGRVLRTDPSLMRNQAYLATYPALAGFLQQHPEIVSGPGFFLENVTVQFWEVPQQRDSRTESIFMWRNTIQSVILLMCFLVVTGGILWIVNALLEWRRWSRTTKVQAEVHNKLLDRFTANEDLLAYIQTPPGRRFLESAPLPVEYASKPVGAPFTRILWSVQAGVVLAAGGFGLLFVSRRVVEEVGQLLFGVGVLVLALGAGFVVSAAASLLLSQRLGLLLSASHEHSDPTGLR